jgi:hypothetical protein
MAAPCLVPPWIFDVSASSLPLYKGPHVETKIHKLEEISCVETSPLPLSHAPPLPSLPCIYLEGYVGVKDYSTTARRRAAKFPVPIQTNLLPQSLLDRRSRGHRRLPYVCEYSEVLHMWHQSHYIRIYMTLSLAMSASSSTLVRERNSYVWYTSVCR